MSDPTPTNPTPPTLEQELERTRALLAPVLSDCQELLVFNGDIMLVTYPDPATVDPAVPYSECASAIILLGRHADDGDVSALLWEVAEHYRAACLAHAEALARAQEREAGTVEALGDVNWPVAIPLTDCPNWGRLSSGHYGPCGECGACWLNANREELQRLAALAPASAGQEGVEG